MPSTGTLVFNDQKLQAPEMYVMESLGVGVSVPTSNLEVTGNAYVSSNLEIGTANLFVDTTTGNVGVGTVSPYGKLGIYTGSTATAGLTIDRYSSGTYRSELYQESDGLAIKVGDGTNAPTENMRITSSTTTTPGKLTVGTGTASSSQMYVYAAGDGSTTAHTDLHVVPNGQLIMYGTRPWITTTNAQGHYDKQCYISLHASGHQPAIEWARNNGQGTNQRNWLLRQEGDDYLHLWHYNGSTWTVPFVFNKDGKLGVGTSSPGVQLHIQGTSPRTLSTANGPSYSDYGQLVITDTTAPSGTATLGNLKIGFDASTGSFGTGFLQCVNPNVYSGPLVLNPYGGNVGIGTSNPNYTIDVNGTIGVSGKQMYPMLRWEIDLTSQSNSNFYPIEFTHPVSEGTPDLPDLHPIHFKVFGESLGGGDPFNENTLVGYAKGGGWSDHGPMYDVHIKRFSTTEHRFQGLYEGSSIAMEHIVIYMRGGYRYSAITDASSVVTHTSAYTIPHNTHATTYAIKNSSGTDVSGTSAHISQLVNLAANARPDERFTSGDFNIDGRVGIGTSSPSYPLHVHSSGATWPNFIVRPTSLWGDGLSTPSETGGLQYMTVGAVMLQGPHITPWSAGGDAYIRYGRAGGVATGVYWETACRADGSFHIAKNATVGSAIHISNTGKVGMGSNSPLSQVDVIGGLCIHQQAGTINWYNGAVNMSVNGYKGLMFTVNGDNWNNGGSSSYWMIGRVPYNTNLHFCGGGRYSCYMRSNTANTALNFTGQHRTFIKDVPFTKANDFEGLIVSASQNKYIKMNGGIEAGSNAITTNESLPVVTISNTSKDKKCFGVISASEDPETREDDYGNLVSVIVKESGDTRVYINSVGEGAIWVTNINGNLESGDYITTSNVAGYGMRQDDDILHNYTVAKITMDCDFEPVTQSVQRIVKELSNVNYWVETTYTGVELEEYSNLAEENRRTVTTTEYSNGEGNISVSEYSNLESNAQATYSEIETITYQKIERTESTTEHEGWTLDVRQELVNVLDEHGQLQWEDHPTETEKAYKIRYLTSDGQITDESNAVHIAAFVGCTYHCG